MKKEKFKIYIGSIIDHDINKSQCTCFEFLKNYICHHVLAIGYRSKLLSFPNSVTSLPLRKKRGKGRPSKVGPALSFN